MNNNHVSANSTLYDCQLIRCEKIAIQLVNFPPKCDTCQSRNNTWRLEFYMPRIIDIQPIGHITHLHVDSYIICFKTVFNLVEEARIKRLGAYLIYFQYKALITL